MIGWHYHQYIIKSIITGTIAIFDYAENKIAAAPDQLVQALEELERKQTSEHMLAALWLEQKDDLKEI